MIFTSSDNMTPGTWLYWFIVYFLYRYARLVVNLWLFWTFKPIPIPENPTLSPSDVTVILPTLDGEGEELERTISSILQNEPKEVILVTIDENLYKAERTVAKMPAAKYARIRCMSVKQANKRRQMARAIPEVNTQIIVFADDDVTWPRETLLWMLAPFEDRSYGGVVTCQRLRRAENPTFSQRIYGFLGALYLERRNFDCAAMTHMDGGMPCLSGRTCAYRTSILQDVNFTNGFTNEKWWFGQYQLNADDDNFLSRWMVSHGHQVYMQYHPNCEVLTTLENNPKFLKQCLRWARSNWRSNLTSMFSERHIWRHQLYSAYAVQLTTLMPPAIMGDALLWWFLIQGTSDWSPENARLAFCIFAGWMTFSKFIKLVTHFVRYPVDIFLWPVSVLFGWFHGVIKLYAVLTLNETTWGSRDNADTSDSERMIKQKKLRHSFESLDEKLHEKLLSNDYTTSYAAHDLKCSQPPLG
ncbi:hypothetical protein HRR83_002440 [Exophiala dermatitidis]|uniref:Polysaccharide synthase Cps1p n=2 Tax=Exophiala dermatitidis TaxID=5970 RepID=H6C0V2_EXODN|nr:uncharacterized protein HMPREF1120_04558 [Exophiala dermatitidis NIH/UT8656]KAJ4524320.1 hypothetical protein HRR74_002518 [Exophiala dermatitidis]EHY56476.1 hypothetical protein HMPREF1120_04558 [Exophiala dermatitidis NIH/UT8656]KAJ4525408.1 hypothetical protein HRR73_002137 [Exophiala dermatitidis]KAJ4536723.1 hypothetical protein HRR76_004749 [Exophiala dermatitidis]KAJ4555674.1 hypothetical protein HRR77_001604 [Exophiala dermatitidis]